MCSSLNPYNAKKLISCKEKVIQNEQYKVFKYIKVEHKLILKGHPDISILCIDFQ